MTLHQGKGTHQTSHLTVPGWGGKNEGRKEGRKQRCHKGTKGYLRALKDIKERRKEGRVSRKKGRVSRKERNGTERKEKRTDFKERNGTERKK